VELGSAWQVARCINQTTEALLTHAIKMEISWVLGKIGIPRKQEADHQAKTANHTSEEIAMKQL